jgi:trk system potassium uptake protein TrkH
VVHAFATAGTGGFSTKNASIAGFNSVYIEMVIAVFMLIFSINFNLFYLILIGNVKKALCNEELRTFMIIVVVATVSIAINLVVSGLQFGEAIRYSFFQVSSITSTSGFATANYDSWPAFSKGILIFLSIVGAMAGSTGGGIKVSRHMVLIKSGVKDVKKLINPKAVVSVRLENQPLEHEVERGVRTYFVFWVTIVVVCTLLLCIDFDNLLTNLTATIACIGNIGPGLQEVGPIGNFAFYSPYSKILLSFVMLVGRLEIFPMLILFVPRTWKRG